MEDYFVINGESSLNLGIHVLEMCSIKKSKRRTTKETLYGKNGYITLSDNSYETTTKTIKGYFQGNTDLVMSFFNVSNAEVVFSNQIDRYYICEFDDEIEFKSLFDNWYEFEVNFECYPLCYLLSGKDTVTITENMNLINQGNKESNPYIKVFGNGNVKLTINGDIITLNNVSEYIELDSEEMECYKDNERLNYNMIGDFPIFQVGENSISWSGNVSKIEITPRWRCL